MVVTPPFGAVNSSKSSRDLKVSPSTLPPAFAMIMASASKYQDDQTLFSFVSHYEHVGYSRNIPPGFKPKKSVGFCRGSKQDTKGLL